VAAYHRHGPQALETPDKGRRQRAYLSLEQEQAGGDPFLKQREVGRVSPGLQVNPALEKAVGHQMAKTPGYRVLKRHPWRKVVPRPRPPKRSAVEQQAFKKTFPHALAPVLPTRAPQDIRPLLSMAEEEGRLGRIDPPRRCWAPKPVRPTGQRVGEFV
jgi:hypothetical protein